MFVELEKFTAFLDKGLHHLEVKSYWGLMKRSHHRLLYSYWLR